MSSVRRLTRDEWREYRALRLRALADSPEAFATTLADAGSRNDDDWLRHAIAGAESSSEIGLVAEVDSRLVGLVWSVRDESDFDRVHLYQMWVDPEFRRGGTGRELLTAALSWAAQVGARLVDLSVTRGNAAATRLYVSAGFAAFGRPEPLRPGSELLVQPMRLVLRDA